MSSSKSSVAVRIAIVVGILGVIAVASLELLAMGVIPRRVVTYVVARLRKSRLPTAEEAAKARRQRQAPVVVVAPAPLPSSLPLRGEPGVDEFGYPRQYVDAGALRSLIWHERYADLTWYFEQYQDKFEADPRFEYWPADASDAFDSSEGALEPAMDAWVQATPSAFAPYLARGSYRSAVAWARRGSQWASDTPESDMTAMREMRKLALEDIRQAAAIRPKLVAALRKEINLTMLGGTFEERRAAIEAAEKSCPSCFQVRVAYLYSITPRWGGSYERMQRFASSVQNPAYPKLAALLGYVDKDKANMLTQDGHYDEALSLINPVCARYNHWEFLDQRAQIAMRMKQPANALPDLEKAMSLRPGNYGLLMRRGAAFSMLARWEEAGRDLLEALRVDPTDDVGRYHFPFVVKGLTSRGWTEFNMGKRDTALRLLDLAAQMAPLDRDVQAARTTVVYGATNRDVPPDENAVAETAKANPDDFRAIQRLDYVMSKQGGRFAEIVGLWNEYLAKHPNDGQAHLERGGAYYHLGKLAEAANDARQACDLGVNEGCVRAKQLGR